MNKQGGPGRGNGTAKHVFAVGATFATAAALWLLFIPGPTLHELILGLLSVIATMAFVYPVSRTMGLELEMRVRDVAQILRVPGLIAVDVARIVMVLAKDLLRIHPAPDLYRVCDFDASKDDPVRMGRTVLAVAFTTVTPNSIVLGVDMKQRRMLFHQLAAADVSTMTKNLGAQG